MVATNLLRPDFWDSDGPIHALVARDGVVFAGGEFSYVAPRGRKVAAVDAYTAEPIREFPNISGSAVHAIVSDQQGGWYLGGDFTAVDGVPRTNLVHVLPDQTVDLTFQPNPNGAVRALVLDGVTLYLGGDFTRVNGQTRARLAAVNLATTSVTAWNPGADQAVHALLLSGDTLYAGGGFLRAGGVDQGRVVALPTAGNTALPWRPQLDGDVLALGLLEDRLVVGGNFNVAGGVSRNGLAAFDLLTGQVDSNWNPNPRDGVGLGGKVTSLRVVCDTVYVGGYFTTIGGSDRARVAAVDVFTGLATAWNPGLGLFRAGVRPSSVQTLEISGDRIFIGGEFNRAQGVSRRDLIAVDATTGQLLAWDPALDGGIVALGVAGRTLLVAFATGPGGVERHNLAAFDEITGRPLVWNPDPNDAVLTLTLAGEALYLGGVFTEVGGATRARLAAVHAGTGALLTNWIAQANSNVQALAVGDGRLFVGGRFTSINGASRRGVAALDLVTGEPIATWAPNVELGTGAGHVQALTFHAGSLYLGGSFTSVSGQARTNLAALDIGNGTVTAWNPGADDDVQALAAGDGVVYVGGQFFGVGGGVGDQPRAGLAAILATGTGAVTPWNPGQVTFDLVPNVRALALSGPLVYIGGAFLELGGAPRLGLGVAHTNGAVLDWNPGASSRNVVDALAVSAQGVYVGCGTRIAPLAFHGAAAPRFLGAFPRAGAPVLLAGPRDEQASLGADVLFAVAVGSDTPLSFQWRFNGLVLPGQTNQTLILTNVQVTHGGVYEVRVANDFGNLTAEGTLLVHSPIQILAAPNPVTAPTGNNIVLSVTATGSPAPIYHWRLNGVLIPGAVYPQLVLSNATARDGGSYSVIVANRSEALITAPVAVNIQTNAAPFSDSFAGRGTIAGTTGTVRGDNASATREDAAGEPRHVAKRGGASVWLKWIAPASGIATFNTRGSGVDTLLGIYTDTTLAALDPVASDEDRGGFLTSRAAFYARAGEEYAIAIDTLGGVTGDLVLSWELAAGTPELPVITGQPLPQTITPGGMATFTVSAIGANGSAAPRFQWFFGCQAIRGATNTTLTLLNVRVRDAGFYHVIAIDDAGQVVESLPAALELGIFPAVRSFEKLEDLLDAIAGAGGGGGGGIAPAASGAPSFPISLGLPISQTFYTSTNGQGTLFSECGTLSGSAVQFTFTAGRSGRMEIDTIGSSFDTVLSVFTNVFIIYLEANRLACDNDSAPEGRSRLTMDVIGGGAYVVRVSGVGGARGLAQLSFHLSGPPVVIRSNETMRVLAGFGVVLDSGVAVSNNIATSYQWLLNGVRLLNATNATLSLHALDRTMAGTYSVIVSNFAGLVTNARAVIEVRTPPRLTGTYWTGGGAFAFSVTGGFGESFAVQASTNLADPNGWAPIWSGTIPVGGSFGPMVDESSTNSLRRFYRVRGAP